MVHAELRYLLLIFCLFVLPPVLQRWRIPAGLSAFALGGAVSAWLGWFQSETALALLAQFGIMALFLLAGLEVDLPSLRRNGRALAGHVLLTLTALGLASWALQRWGGLEAPVAWLCALVLVTPSTGFILGSLEHSSFGPAERGWVKNIAIAVELAALLVLFLVLRSSSPRELLLSTAAYGLILALLPWVLRGYARFIAPHAPGTEFAFLMMVALLCGTLTRALGTYYLVGAFMVGLAAQRFRGSLPSLSSERLLYALKVFAFFFLPFYFFRAGQAFGALQLRWEGLALGLILLVLVVPLRLLLTWAQLQWVLGEALERHRDVAVALLPNLVFGIVLSGLLRERYGIDPVLDLGLITYTAVVSMAPSLLQRKALASSPVDSLPEPPSVEPR